MAVEVEATDGVVGCIFLECITGLCWGVGGLRLIPCNVLALKSRGNNHFVIEVPGKLIWLGRWVLRVKRPVFRGKWLAIRGGSETHPRFHPRFQTLLFPSFAFFSAGLRARCAFKRSRLESTKSSSSTFLSMDPKICL